MNCQWMSNYIEYLQISRYGTRNRPKYPYLVLETAPMTDVYASWTAGWTAGISAPPRWRMDAHGYTKILRSGFVKRGAPFRLQSRQSEEIWGDIIPSLFGNLRSYYAHAGAGPKALLRNTSIDSTSFHAVVGWIGLEICLLSEFSFASQYCVSNLHKYLSSTLSRSPWNLALVLVCPLSSLLHHSAAAKLSRTFVFYQTRWNFEGVW